MIGCSGTARNSGWPRTIRSRSYKELAFPLVASNCNLQPLRFWLFPRLRTTIAGDRRVCGMYGLKADVACWSGRVGRFWIVAVRKSNEAWTTVAERRFVRHAEPGTGRGPPLP